MVILGPSILRSSALPVESPIQNVYKDTSYVSMTPPKSVTNGNATNRRRTLSDYRTGVESNAALVQSNSSGTAVSSIKNATKTLTTGLSKFTAKRMVS